MDTNAPKTPATLPLAEWQSLSPVAAAREVHARLAALPPALRRAAVAWVLPEAELAAQLVLRRGADLLRPSTTATQRAQQACAPTSESLHGVPYALKDLFDLAGAPTKAGSTFLDKVRPTPATSSHLVRRLGKLGAVCAAKTHLVEFASGLTGENPHYGDCPHPQFPDRLTGGSSSGSAALVAAGVVPLAIGTDTGGSIRVPAAFCGLYGFRLTPGDEFIRDAFPLAPTMDTAGWFTRTAGDMLIVWAALVTGRASPPDEPPVAQSFTARPEDSPYPPAPRGCYLPMTALLPGADPVTARACDQAAAALCPLADEATQRQLLDSWREAVPAYISIGMSEAHQVHRNWLAPYHEHYDPVIWQRFTDAGHFAPERIASAREVFAQVRATWAEFFTRYDFLVLPATPGPAPRKADCTPELRRDILTLTAPASLGGLPVLSVPVPLPDGLTCGLQIILPHATSPVVPWLLSLRP